jgi:hypothetical protein
MHCCSNYDAVLVLQICERSLTQSTGGPSGPTTPNFIRAEVLPSGYLIRPCEGGGSMIHIVDHVDLDVSSNKGFHTIGYHLNTFGRHASYKFFVLCRPGVCLRSFDRSTSLPRFLRRR